MNIMELGAIGELVGGVAVIASLIFVGIQVRQSAKAQVAASVDIAIDRVISINSAVIADPEMARIVLEGSSGRPLDPVDYHRFHLLLRNIFSQADIVRVKRDAGMVDDSAWHFRRSSLQGLITLPGIVEWWDRNAGDFSPEFRAYIAENRSAAGTAVGPIDAESGGA